MLDKFKAFFRGGVYENTKKNFYPIGTGRRVVVDAAGDVIFATCIEILAKNIGQIQWGLYDPGGNTPVVFGPRYDRALNVEPYDGINAYEFWRWIEVQRNTYGNAYAYIQCGKSGVVEKLIPLNAFNVRAYWDNADILQGQRKMVYEYYDSQSGHKFTILPEEILHFKAFSANGLVGRRAIDVLMNALKGSAESESAMRSAVINGFSGTIVLSYTSDLSASKQKELQSQVRELLSDSNNTILPLPAGMTATNISNAIKDYYESLQQTSAQKISSFFGIPLAMLNVGGGAGMATFSTNQMAQFFNQTMIPIITQYAAEFRLKLLDRADQMKGYRFLSAGDVFDTLDAQSKASVLAAYTGAGILTPNEARRSLRYPAIDAPGADMLTQRGGTGALGDSGGDEGGNPRRKEGG